MKWERILNSSRKKKLFIIAAVFVAFFTIYSLVLPAVTLDNDTASDEPGLNTDTISQEETNIYNTVYDPFSIEQEKENELKQAEDTIFFYYESEEIKVTVEAPKDAFPEGTEMVVTPIAEEEVLDAVTNTIEKVKKVQAVDITFYYNGEEIEPLKPIKVSLVSEVIKEAKDLQIVHIDDEGTGTLVEQADVETEEDEVVFESKDFSAYVVVETEIETTVITADGEEYNITVSYDENAMIPEGAHLEAEEILPEDERYQEYYDTLTDLLESELNYVRLFDISIMNGEEKVQPKVEVNVKIELDDLTSEEESLKAVHISDEGETEVLKEVKLNEETAKDTEETTKSVEFDAKGFSVYAIVGTEEDDPSNTNSVLFTFWYGAEGHLTVYTFNNEAGESVNSVYVTSSEHMVNPGLPGYSGDSSSVAQAFIGWCYAKYGEGEATPTLKKGIDNNPIAYDFSKTLDENLAVFAEALGYEDVDAFISGEGIEQDSNGSYQIPLIGTYNNAVYVYYYSQSSAQIKDTDDQTDDQPEVYDIHAVNLIPENGKELLINSEGKETVGYVPDSSQQAFLGWSTYTPKQQRGLISEETSMKDLVLYHDDHTEDVNYYGKVISYLEQGDDGNVQNDTAQDSVINLYPVVADVFWVTYDKNDWIYTYDTSDGAYVVKEAVPNEYGQGMYNLVDGIYVYTYGSGNWDVTFTYAGTQQGNYSRSGSGADYVAPVYVLEGESLNSSDNNGFPDPEPSWDGYEFAGWFADEALTVQFSADTIISSVYTLYNGGNEDDHSLTLYAKWRPKTTTYTVSIWLENADDDDYSFVTSYILTGETKGTTNARNFITNGGAYYRRSDDGTISQAGSFADRIAFLRTVFGSEVIRYNNVNHTYYEYTYYDYENPRLTEATISGDGSTVVNVYYDRNEYRVRFYYGWAATSGGTPIYERVYLGTANNGTITGVTGTQGNYYYTTETGETRVYWRNGYFRTRNNNNANGYSGAVWESVQTGTSGGTQTYYISTTRTDYNAFGSSTDRQQTTQAVLESVNGYGTITEGNNTVYYFDLTAKYEADLTDLWPTKILTTSGNEMNTGDYAFISWLTDSESVYRAFASSNANIKGTYSSMNKVLITKTDGTVTNAENGGIAHIAHARFDDEYYNYQYYYYLWDPNTTTNTAQYTAEDINGFTSATKYPSSLNAAPSLPEDLTHYDSYLYVDTDKNESTAYSGDWTTYMVSTRSAGYVQQQALMEVAGYTRVAYTGYLGSGGPNSGTGASSSTHTEGHMYFYFWPNLNELNFVNGGNTISNSKAYYTEDISDNSERSTKSDIYSSDYMSSHYGSNHAGYEFVGWFADNGLGTYVFFHKPNASEIYDVLYAMVDRDETSRFNEISSSAYNALDDDGKAAIVTVTDDVGTHYYQLNYIVYESMPDSGLTFYAGWRPSKYRVWIQPNGGQLNTSGMATYFNNTYQQLVGKYENVMRNFVPASRNDEDATKYAYIFVSTSSYSKARIALYVAREEISGDEDTSKVGIYNGYKYYYYDSIENTDESIGSNKKYLTPTQVSAAINENEINGFDNQLEDNDFSYVYKYNGYTLVGWYHYEGPETVQGLESGSTAPSILTSDDVDTPWNFGTGITEHTAIRAIWKRTGYLTVVYQADGYQLNDDGTLTEPSNGDDIPDATDIEDYGTTDYSYADNSQGVAGKTPEFNDGDKWLFLGWITPDYQEITGNVDLSTYLSYIHDSGSTYTIYADFAILDDGTPMYEGDDNDPDEYHFYYVLHPVFAKVGQTKITYTWTNNAESTMLSKELDDYGAQLTTNLSGELVESAISEYTKADNTISGLRIESPIRVSSGKGFERKGYKLIGWNDSESAADEGVVKFKLGENYGVSSENLTESYTFTIGETEYTVTNTNVLYAVWTRAITFDFIKINKSNDALSGASFEVYDNAQCTGDPIAAATSDSDGKVSFLIERDNLTTGSYTYYFKETEAPENYKLSDEIFTVIITVVDLDDSSKDSFVIKDSSGNVITSIINDDNSYEITIVKVDNNNPANQLENAKFKLLKWDSTLHKYVSISDELNEFTAGITTVSLDSGYYELTELAAPDGYIVRSGSIYFYLNATIFEKKMTYSEGQEADVNANNEMASIDGTSMTITVINEPGAELPMTGGPGTSKYMILGSILIAGSLMYEYSLRRKNRKEVK